MSGRSRPECVIRPASPEHASACGKICYTAFRRLSEIHAVPCDIPGPQAAIRLLRARFRNPGFYCAVTECGGAIVGSGCMDRRSTVHGLGPVSIAPEFQNQGLGRTLTCDLMDHGSADCRGIRLVQAAFHNRSLSLYARLGFLVRESLACLQGTIREKTIRGCSVRKAEASDRLLCDALALRIHGFDRGIELSEAIQMGTARVVERDGRITGYATALGFAGHSTAETNQDLQALIATPESFGGAGFLLPLKNTALFRWCLENGLRVVQQMNLMSVGFYNDPGGAWLPSVLF